MNTAHIPNALLAVALILTGIGAGSLSRKRYISGAVTVLCAVAVAALTSLWATNLRIEQETGARDRLARLTAAVDARCDKYHDDRDRIACVLATHSLYDSLTH